MYIDKTSLPAWALEDLEPVANCPFCHAQGQRVVYNDLADITFGSSRGPFRMVACTTCGAGYLNPRPTAATIGAAYASYYTHAAAPAGTRRRRGLGRIRQLLANDYRRAQYGAKVDAALPFGRAVVNRMPGQKRVIDAHYRFLPPCPPGGRLLDFGCGNGAFLRLARNELGWEAVGVDFDSKAVEAARMDGFEAETGGEETLPRWDNHFHAITAAHVFEHVYDPRALAEGLFKALAPGGFLFVETPNMDGLGHAIWKANWRGLEAPRHLGIPTWKSMEMLLASAGFSALTRHPRADVFDPMYRRSAALAEGQNSEDPAALTRPGPTDDQMAELAADPMLSDYMTMTATKPA